MKKIEKAYELAIKSFNVFKAGHAASFRPADVEADEFEEVQSEKSKSGLLGGLLARRLAG
jgi:hypothetical protein